MVVQAKRASDSVKEHEREAKSLQSKIDVERSIADEHDKMLARLADANASSKVLHRLPKLPS